VLAALGRARRVFALARSSAHGSIEEIMQATSRLAASAKVGDRIEIVTEKQPETVGQADLIAQRYPGAIVAQFWGDVDRLELSSRDVPFWPVEAAPPGHQGIPTSSIGPEAVVRLQAGGLKVGEVMPRVRVAGSNSRDPVGTAVAAAVARHRAFDAPDGDSALIS
jgi:hypothetical protein